MNSMVTTYFSTNSRAINDLFATNIAFPEDYTVGLRRIVTLASGSLSSGIHLDIDVLRSLIEHRGLAASFDWFTSLQQRVQHPASNLATQRTRNEAALRLLKKWMADESGYDEETWPKLKKAIENNRLSYRRRFND